MFSNWAVKRENSATWSGADRVSVRGVSALLGDEQEFRGLWLVIDEFNRAPIDLALGEALTALGGSGRLRVPTDSGTAELLLPQDFRIIGTLNSFDRNYLNQISEALKRRFAFIESFSQTAHKPKRIRSCSDRPALFERPAFMPHHWSSRHTTVVRATTREELDQRAQETRARHDQTLTNQIRIASEKKAST